MVVPFTGRAGRVRGRKPVVDMSDKMHRRRSSSIQSARRMRYDVTADMPFLHKIWMTLDDPAFSRNAYIYANFSLSIIAVSTMSFCLETEFSCSLCNELCGNRTADVSVEPASLPAWPCSFLNDSNCKRWEQAWSVIEILAVICFTLEFVLRVISTPSKQIFFRGLANWIDLIAIVPFYVNLCINAVEQGTGASSLGAFSVFRVVRLVRVFRVFKMGKSSQGIQLMGTTLWMSMKVLSVLLFSVLIATIVFSSTVYYAEDAYTSSPQRENFLSIPRTFWWCLVTMTTVGYGDAYPITFWGRLVALVTMFLGILILALPITVIGSSFSSQFDRQVFESQVERNCTVREGKDNVMDVLKLGEFLKEMDIRGNLKVPLPATPKELEALLSQYDVRTNGKLDKGEWKAMIEDLVMNPSDFTGVTVQKIAMEMYTLRNEVSEMHRMLRTQQVQSERQVEQIRQLLLLLGHKASGGDCTRSIEANGVTSMLHNKKAHLLETTFAC